MMSTRRHAELREEADETAPPCAKVWWFRPPGSRRSRRWFRPPVRVAQPVVVADVDSHGYRCCRRVGTLSCAKKRTKRHHLAARCGGFARVEARPVVVEARPVAVADVDSHGYRCGRRVGTLSCVKKRTKRHHLAARCGGFARVEARPGVAAVRPVAVADVDSHGYRCCRRVGTLSCAKSGRNGTTLRQGVVVSPARARGAAAAFARPCAWRSRRVRPVVRCADSRTSAPCRTLDTDASSQGGENRRSPPARLPSRAPSVPRAFRPARLPSRAPSVPRARATRARLTRAGVDDGL